MTIRTGPFLLLWRPTRRRCRWAIICVLQPMWGRGYRSQYFILRCRRRRHRHRHSLRLRKRRRRLFPLCCPLVCRTRIRAAASYRRFDSRQYNLCKYSRSIISSSFVFGYASTKDQERRFDSANRPEKALVQIDHSPFLFQLAEYASFRLVECFSHN